MSDAVARERDPETMARLALWCGPLSITVSAVGILAATLLAPWFSWSGNALSDLGAVGAGTAPVFNGTLLLTGVLGVPFALFVLRRRSSRWRRVGTALFAASMPLLTLVGVFALPSPYHGPVAVGFFLLFTLGFLVDGVGATVAGDRVDGALSITLAGVHVLGWLVWGIVGLAGVALPEMVGTVTIWVWVLRRFREFRP